jgi:hypothetical protein
VTAVRIVVALEPRSHRETLRDAIAQLRPQLDPVAVAPEVLRTRPGRFASSVILLNHPVPTVQSRAFAWVVILPAPGARALVSIAGEEWLVEKLELSGLLSLIDFSLTAFRIARTRLPELRSSQSRSGMVAKVRSYFGALAPWQHAHMFLVAMLLPLGILLTCSYLADNFSHWQSGLLLVALTGIAALEVRQFRQIGHQHDWQRETTLVDDRP